MVGAGIGLTHRASQIFHLKTNFTQRPSQQTVHFVAPTTAFLEHNFLKRSSWAEFQGAPKMNVQIFIKDVQQVLTMHTNQRFKIDLELARVLDALKVSLEVLGFSLRSKILRLESVV
jgi:hypothetical protein